MDKPLLEDARALIQYLALEKHPEGGYFKETYRSADKYAGTDSADFPSGRSLSTGIYFMLQKEDFSAFHRIKSDEMWHFYTGTSIVIYVLHPSGRLEEIHLGQQISQGESLQALVPAYAWFASELKHKKDFALLGCTVAPGFDFQDFEMADRLVLQKEFPAYTALIERLTYAP